MYPCQHAEKQTRKHHCLDASTCQINSTSTHQIHSTSTRKINKGKPSRSMASTLLICTVDQQSTSYVPGFPHDGRVRKPEARIRQRHNTSPTESRQERTVTVTHHCFDFILLGLHSDHSQRALQLILIDRSVVVQVEGIEGLLDCGVKVGFIQTPLKQRQITVERSELAIYTRYKTMSRVCSVRGMGHGPTPCAP